MKGAASGMFQRGWPNHLSLATRGRGRDFGGFARMELWVRRSSVSRMIQIVT